MELSQAQFEELKTQLKTEIAEEIKQEVKASVTKEIILKVISENLKIRVKDEISCDQRQIEIALAIGDQESSLDDREVIWSDEFHLNF